MPVTISCTPQVRGSKYTCLLAEQSRGKNFILYKPNIGKQSQPESLDSLQKKYRRVGGTCSPQCGGWGRLEGHSLSPCHSSSWLCCGWAGMVVAPGVLTPSPGFHIFCILDSGKFLMLSVVLQVLPEEAKEHWESSYHFSLKNCNHAVW